MFAHKKDHLPLYRGLGHLGRESISQLQQALQPSSFHKAHLSRKGRLLICPHHNRQTSIKQSPSQPAACRCQAEPLPRRPTHVCALKSRSVTGYAHTYFLSSPPTATHWLHYFCKGKGKSPLWVEDSKSTTINYRVPKGRWLPERRRIVPTACFCGDEITEFRFCIWSYMGFKGHIQ